MKSKKILVAVDPDGVFLCPDNENCQVNVLCDVTNAKTCADYIKCLKAVFTKECFAEYEQQKLFLGEPVKDVANCLRNEHAFETREGDVRLEVIDVGNVFDPLNKKKMSKVKRK